jgi:hypothetical protein
MSETEKPFTVSDRRHFTPEGRPRDDAGDSPGAGESRPQARPEADPAGPAAPRADFSDFLLSLAAQAGAFLSGEGLPEGTGPSEALEGARSVIAVLEMLKEKTEGRRTAPEETLLDELLFQLRMAYVEKTRAGGV